MNPQEQGETTQTGNEHSRKKVDILVKMTLDQLIQSGDHITPAMINALTKRYGRPVMTDEEQTELDRQLKLVGGDAREDTG